MGDPNDETRELIQQTGNLRDDLLMAVARLEQYAEDLQSEVRRLKAIAERAEGAENGT